MKFKVKASSPIWTGNFKNTGKTTPLRISGIIGSLRWWYELAVRSLEGYACCPESSPCSGKDNHCAVCNLFGCTDWARKFKLRVTCANGDMAEKIMKGQEYFFEFIFFRPADDEEKWLLARLIEQVIIPYGSIGGKMTNKPSESAFSNDNRLKEKQEAVHHSDFGLFELVLKASSNLQVVSEQQVRDYIGQFRVIEENKKVRENHPDWPVLNHLFAIKTDTDFDRNCFDQVKIKKLTGIDPPNSSAIGCCLRGKGGENGYSKKIFSFKKDRVWGYCKDDTTRSKIIAEIAIELAGCGSNLEKTDGCEMLTKLFIQEQP